MRLKEACGEEAVEWTGAVSTIPRLTGDLYDQDATQGAGSEYQNLLHHMKKVLMPDDVIQSGLKPAPCQPSQREHISPHERH